MLQRVNPFSPAPVIMLPRNPPMNAPTMPIIMETMMPPGSMPGMIALAIAPAIRPRTIHARIPIFPPVWCTSADRMEHWCPQQVQPAYHRAARWCSVFPATRLGYGSMTAPATHAHEDDILGKAYDRKL